MEKVKTLEDVLRLLKSKALDFTLSEHNKCQLREAIKHIEILEAAQEKLENVNPEKNK